MAESVGSLVNYKKKKKDIFSSIYEEMVPLKLCCQQEEVKRWQAAVLGWKMFPQSDQ